MLVPYTPIGPTPNSAKLETGRQLKNFKKMAFEFYLLPKKWYLFPIPLAGVLFGAYLNRTETERLTLFRDKSALYGRELKEGEAPTWP